MRPRLEEIGLRSGDTVRFRRTANEHWHEGQVECRERDGSIRLRDGKGAARAISAELIEVRTTGPRGGIIWEPLPQYAARTEQLRLL